MYNYYCVYLLNLYDDLCKLHLSIHTPSPLVISEVERQNTVIVTLTNLTTSTVSFIIFVIVDVKISHLDNNFYHV